MWRQVMLLGLLYTVPLAMPVQAGAPQEEDARVRLLDRLWDEQDKKGVAFIGTLEKVTTLGEYRADRTLVVYRLVFTDVKAKRGQLRAKVEVTSFRRPVEYRIGERYSIRGRIVGEGQVMETPVPHVAFTHRNDPKWSPHFPPQPRFPWDRFEPRPGMPRR